MVIQGSGSAIEGEPEVKKINTTLESFIEVYTIEGEKKSKRKENIHCLQNYYGVEYSRED